MKITLTIYCIICKTLLTYWRLCIDSKTGIISFGWTSQKLPDYGPIHILTRENKPN